MNTSEKTRRFHSFFDLQRAAVIRDTPSVRLRKAAQEGNLAAVKRLVKKVTNIQNPDPETGNTTLMYAAMKGNVEMVEYLLAIGHEEEVISVDYEGITVLMLAAMYNHIEIFFLYVNQYKECIHAISKSGWTALLYAAQNGNTTLVGFLLSVPVDLDHTDNEGNSALHYAAAWEHFHVMDLLVSEGCNVDLQNNAQATAYDYAYSKAVQEHLKEIAQVHSNDDSSLSIASSQKPNAVAHLGTNAVSVSRTSSYPGQESPVLRASTSSSSSLQPSIPSSSPHPVQHGSPGSFSELERQRASSFGDTKQTKSAR
ncbi:ankyrin repeat-containing domain protein [Sporodiniella umbellata]|nr:ankyrin repeat-containing domain protein [Sporodiniella umbellata]